jgi:hypothetical protein
MLLFQVVNFKVGIDVNSQLVVVGKVLMRLDLVQLGIYFAFGSKIK